MSDTAAGCGSSPGYGRRDSVPMKESQLKDNGLKENLHGAFIVLDGPDGCGKSTQLRLLTDWLNDNDVETAGFRDPGGTTIGEQIRTILLSPAHDAMDTRTELLLYMAARAQLWREKIAPSLEGGRCVVLDRWLSSTCAYQGYAGGFGLDAVVAMAEDCLERAWPDLTVVLDIDTQAAMGRLDRRLDRMEAKGREYHGRVRQGFLELASRRKDFIVVDAARGIERVHEEVLACIRKCF